MYKYGMRYRGFSLGCQPMDGFCKREDDPSGVYHDILFYARKLTDDEVTRYELDPLGEDALVIHIPVDGDAVDRICRLFEAKKALIEKATNAQISVLEQDGYLSFKVSHCPDPEMVHTLTLFFSYLCAYAASQKRITAKARNVPNERYALRTFLVRIGMNGTDTKEARHILLRNLTGDAAFRNGRP